MKQLALTFPEKKQRGGARVGAGRKKLRGALSHTPHRARPVHRAAHPVHVTLRASLHSLRSQRVARVVLGAVRDSNSERFRVTHYSVQDNHVHLLVEAGGKRELSRGMRSLAVRLAKRVNRLLSRRGRFWADRWHGHALRSPREVRNALVYVLQNRKKHVPRGRWSRLLIRFHRLSISTASLGGLRILFGALGRRVWRARRHGCSESDGGATG